MGQLRMRSLGLMLFAVLAGCAKAPAASTLPEDALEAAIGQAIGDPTTCVLLADPATGKTLYRYGQLFNCQRGLAACDRPGTLSAQAALALADTPDGRRASCPSVADGSRSVGWAQGRITGGKRPLLYSAVIEGERALPGQEIAARLEGAFRKTGLQP